MLGSFQDGSQWSPTPRILALVYPISLSIEFTDDSCLYQWTCSFSHVQLFATPWTTAYQAPLSMGFSRQEYWNGLPFPSPGDLPNPGIEPRSPALQADSTIWATREAQRLTLLQFSSVAQSCPTLCNPMNRSTPGLPVHHQLPEFTQTHVHWVSDKKWFNQFNFLPLLSFSS